jgi:serine phosphatase RsbU (regulator of sigma subunit)
MARLCIADVTGHGEEVSMFSSWLEKVFSRHMNNASPAGVLRGVNKQALKRGFEVMSTALCISYNSLNGELRFCNAGHPKLMVHRKDSDQWEALLPPVAGDRSHCNIPLGVSEKAKYTVGMVKLDPGDRLFIYTDGLNEARGADGGEFGEDRLEEALLTARGHDPHTQAETLIHALDRHLGADARAQDDVTFTILEAQPYECSSRLALLIKNNWARMTGKL